MNRIENLQALRGIAALGVMAFHVAGQLDARLHVEGAAGWCTFGRYGVDLFFVISGVILTLTTRSSHQKPAASARFIYLRLSRIYPPYWLYTLMVFAVTVYFPGVFEPRPTSLLKSFFLMPQRALPLVVVGWTLVYELYFYLAFSVFLCLKRRHLPLALSGWAAATLIGNLATSANQASLPAAASVMIFPYAFEFICGCLAGLALSPDELRSPFLAPSAAAVGVMILIGQFADNATASLWRQVALLGVPFAVLTYACIGLEYRGALLMPRALRFLGAISYSLYLSHVFVLAAVSAAFGALGARSWPGVAIGYAIAAAAASMCAGWIGYRFFELPCLALFRRALPEAVRKMRAG
jgi:peptidoglycan/LPS O-acetylase OafA/YrhL